MCVHASPKEWEAIKFCPNVHGRTRFGIISRMTATAKKLLERVASWPEEDIDMLERAVCAIEAWRNGEYAAEISAIDENSELP